MRDEIYLYNLKDSDFKSLEARGYRNPTVPKFPVLTNFTGNDFHIYDLLHLIEITKVVKNKTDIKSFLGDQYHTYIQFKESFTNQLPIFNDELFRKYTERHGAFEPDCIIVPESKNDWLRKGLAEKFSTELNIPIHIAKKNIDIEFSQIDTVPNDFKFGFNFDVASINNAIIIDECKSKGNTTSSIKSEFNNHVSFIDIVYLKNTP